MSIHLLLKVHKYNAQSKTDACTCYHQSHTQMAIHSLLKVHKYNAQSKTDAYTCYHQSHTHTQTDGNSFATQSA